MSADAPGGLNRCVACRAKAEAVGCRSRSDYTSWPPAIARTLTVAVLGDREHAFETYNVAMPAENLAQRYEQRLKLAVDAEDEEP